MANVSHKIDLRLTNAMTGLDELLEDPNNLGTFAFVDADKSNYDHYYEKLLRLLKKGGWIAFDNCFAHNGVLNPQEKNPFFTPKEISALHQLNIKL